MGARTDVGRVREGNEDAYTAEAPLFAVADGMGGHQGGEVASHLALETLGRVSDRPAPDGDAAPHLAETVREANRAVLDRASSDPGLTGMGTTLTAVLAGGDRIFLAHVGDSRAYLLRDGELSRLTKDHTVVERLVDQGRLTSEEAAIHPQRSILTNALGVDRDIQVDEAAYEVRAGDRLLLCSDGLTGMVSEENIVRILTDERDPQAAAEALVAAANEAGGQDNITAVVLDAQEDETGEEDGWAIPASEAAPGRRWPRRVLLWVLLPLVLVAGALFGVKRLFIDQQWFVGVTEGQVALYRGIPAEPLGISLATVELRTDLPADEVQRFTAWQDLDQGITTGSREDGERLISQMREDLEAERAKEREAKAKP
ncbi:MAG: Stp1/IreP family PP2C-type Ser/Thr phosphatase [Actinomycetota bacterium]